MSEIISAPVVNGHNEVNTVDKDEDNFDKDSGNHSGEEIDMETKNEPTCGQKNECELDKDGPHCHVDDEKPKSNASSRKNSIAEELKQKIASVSRRNSFGSRRSSVTGSRRNSIHESIKEDPTCEDECNDQAGWGTDLFGAFRSRKDQGAHCHVPDVPPLKLDQEDPTCEKKCPDTGADPHCHINDKEDDKSADDPTCAKDSNCPVPGQDDHCHVDNVDNVSQGLLPANEVTNDANPPNDNDRKLILQTNSPGGEPGPEPGRTVEASSCSTPPTARKIIQTPVNMKDTDSPDKKPSGSNETGVNTTDSVVDNMPPTEHHNAENVIVTRDEENKKPAENVADLEATNAAEDDERKSRGGNPENSQTRARVDSRARSKSRASSPSTESRRSRFSSKERKSSGLEKVNHDLPDVANIRSKLDDKNLDYKPPTSTKKIEVRKLNWRAESKIENNNLDYKKKALQVSIENGIDKIPKKIENHKLEWKAEAKTVTRNSSYVPATKSDKKIETYKINWNAESKLNTRENMNYKTENVSPTRSATLRRQRSRSSHGADRSKTAGSDSKETNNLGQGRLTTSAVITRRPTGTGPTTKQNSVAAAN